MFGKSSFETFSVHFKGKLAGLFNYLLIRSIYQEGILRIPKKNQDFVKGEERVEETDLPTDTP